VPDRFRWSVEHHARRLERRQMPRMADQTAVRKVAGVGMVMEKFRRGVLRQRETRQDKRKDNPPPDLT
jgi:hypothetical protein